MDPVEERLESARAQLISDLREHALVIGRVTLSSGAEAEYYVDARRALMRPTGFRAAGELIATVALPPQVPRAVDADFAGLVLLADGGQVRDASAGAAHQSVDPSRKLFDVDATGSGRPADVARAYEFGVLATAAQLVGAAQAMLDLSVEYAKQRHQFGRPIGSYQAIKHKLADVHIAIELARPLVYGAALSLADGSPDTARDVSAAKVAAGDAALQAARSSLQTHGAIGFTAEHDLSLWLLRVQALRTAWGDPVTHRRRVLEGLS